MLTHSYKAVERCKITCDTHFKSINNNIYDYGRSDPYIFVHQMIFLPIHNRFHPSTHLNDGWTGLCPQLVLAVWPILPSWPGSLSISITLVIYNYQLCINASLMMPWNYSNAKLWLHLKWSFFGCSKMFLCSLFVVSVLASIMFVFVTSWYIYGITSNILVKNTHLHWYIWKLRHIVSLCPRNRSHSQA